MLNRVVSAQMLKENIVPNPSIHVRIPHQKEAANRVMSNFSINKVTAGSMREMDEVHAATKRRTKKQHAKYLTAGHVAKGNGESLEN